MDVLIKILDFCKKNIVMVSVISAVVILMAVFFIVKLTAGNNDETIKPSSSVPEVPQTVEYNQLPENITTSFEVADYALENLGGESVKFKCFKPDQEMSESDEFIYYSGSADMQIMVYLENITDVYVEMSPEIFSTFLNERKFLAEEIYYTTNNGNQIYLAFGPDADNVYTGRSFIVKDNKFFIVATSTVDMNPPRDELQKQQIREACLLAVSTFEIL